MENHLQILSINFAVTSTLMLLGLLYARYYKATCLESVSRFKMSSPYEHRRMDRVDYESNIDLSDGSGRRDQSARLVNISLGGLCFLSSLPLKPGEHVQATWAPSKVRCLEIGGRVAWQKLTGNGTLFGIAIKDVVDSRV